MKNTAPQGPTISSSSNLTSNFTRLLKVTENIEGNFFSSPNPSTPDINTTLSGGILSNLNDPILDSQGATYAYALSQGGTSNPGGPVRSIQYNNSGIFNGSSSLTFNNGTNTLSASNISNGTINIGLNTITGLSDPVLGQQAATKNYADYYSGLTITSVNTVGPTTYTPVSVINGLIYRDTQTSGTTIDNLPTAAQIIAASGATVGTTITFSIKNISSDITNVVQFNPGLGITTSDQINIFSGYQYNGIMIVTNIGTGTEAITLYYINTGRTNTTKYAIELGGSASIIDVIRITDYLMVYNQISDITVSPPSSPVITANDVANKIIKVNLTGPGNIMMAQTQTFMGIFEGTDLILNPFIWTTGGMDFYIMNTSTVPGAGATLIGNNGGIIPWSFDSNSNMLINPGYTGWFMLVLDVTNFPEAASLLSATVYTLGIFPTS